MRQSYSIQAVVAISLITVGMLASADVEADQVCSGTTCPLGGQQRMQISFGGPQIPVPISEASAQTGLVTSQPGAVAAIPGATIMQTLGGPEPRRLTLAPAQFAYDEDPVHLAGRTPADPGTAFFFQFRPFAVSTDLIVQFPHPNDASAMFSAGGRPGPATVSWCAGSPAPTGTFNPGCIGPNTTFSLGQPATNGLVRYRATRNQFGGVASAKVLGSVKVFWNVGGLFLSELPCRGGPGCLVGVQSIAPASRAVLGQDFGVTELTPAVVNPTGIWTASIQTNGAVVLGNPVPPTPNQQQQDQDGNGFLDFTGHGATSWGFPWTTGQLLISATQAGRLTEDIFIRTGTDMRNAAGSGIVSLVSGSLSRRTLTGSRPGRGYLTLKIPEPGMLVAGSAALLMLAACHWLARRRLR